jgi:hypothetical protein
MFLSRGCGVTPNSALKPRQLAALKGRMRVFILFHCQPSSLEGVAPRSLRQLGRARTLNKFRPSSARNWLRTRKPD